MTANKAQAIAAKFKKNPNGVVKEKLNEAYHLIEKAAHEGKYTVFDSINYKYNEIMEQVHEILKTDGYEIETILGDPRSNDQRERVNTYYIKWVRPM